MEALAIQLLRRLIDARGDELEIALEDARKFIALGGRNMLHGFGRPPRYADEVYQFIAASAAVEGGTTTKRIAKAVEARFGVKISPHTIGYHLRGSKCMLRANLVGRLGK